MNVYNSKTYVAVRPPELNLGASAATQDADRTCESPVWVVRYHDGGRPAVPHLGFISHQLHSDAVTVAVRIEGGLGDHVLALRLLPFVRHRFPNFRIIVYSDCAGAPQQLQLLSWAKHVDAIVPVFKHPLCRDTDEWWRFENLCDTDRQLVRSAEVFVDADHKDFFIQASQILQVPYFSLLAGTTELSVPNGADQIEHLLGPIGTRRIALSLSKFGVEGLARILPIVTTMLASALGEPEVRVFNIFQRQPRFPHWPTSRRITREDLAAKEAIALEQFSLTDKRIIPLIDLPLDTIARLIQRCDYFIGVDNGIKHLAWALNVPRTLLLPERPDEKFILRWIPDFHRALILDELHMLTHHVQSVSIAVRPSGCADDVSSN